MDDSELKIVPLTCFEVTLLLTVNLVPSSASRITLWFSVKPTMVQVPTARLSNLFLRASPKITTLLLPIAAFRGRAVLS